jgi:tetratricopeptide (TPR) repeat protein
MSPSLAGQTGPRLTLALLALAAALPAAAEARAAPGMQLEDVELRTLAGGRERLLSTQAKANVIVFFRPSQDRSLDTLKQLAVCERDLAGKPVHWAAVVSAAAPMPEVKAAVAASGIRMPVLLDEGDALYERLAIRMHPMVGIVDQKLTLVALEPYRQISYCDVIMARIRVLLGELDEAGLAAVLDPPKGTLPGENPMKKAMRDVNMARHLVALGQHAQAVKYAEKALAIAPVSQAFTVMGIAYARQGRCADAARAFDRALKLDPKDAEAAKERAACR